MWERLTPADIEQARHRLALERGSTLLRHAEELRSLDREQDEIETLARLIAAFTEKYTSSAPSQPTTSSEGQESIQVQHDAPSPRLQIVQQVSPNFDLIRRLVG
jgi:hypothetical protein